MSIFSTTDLITKIRDYQKQNLELIKNSHHFVFDCPFNSTNRNKPDFIWIGLNPGNDSYDMNREKGNGRENTEETRDKDFQNIFHRSDGSRKRMKKIKDFLGQNIFDKTTHTELFFWCSADIGKDFERRYRTKFHSSPHLNFCLEMNRQLILRIAPKLIFLEGMNKAHSYIDILRRVFSISKVKSIPVETSDYSRYIDIYLLDNKFELYNFDHLSARGKMMKTNKLVPSIVRSNIKDQFGL